MYFGPINIVVVVRVEVTWATRILTDATFNLLVFLFHSSSPKQVSVLRSIYPASTYTQQLLQVPTMSGTYSGSLQIKKKAELQEIAQALAISDAGTREDLLQRIKKHLEDNSAELESDPAFSGLYTTRGGRRQRSVQPASGVPPPHSTGDNSKFAAIPEERAVTPPAEESGLRSAPQSPGLGTGLATPSPSRRRGSASPRNISSPAKSLVAEAKAQPEVQPALKGGSNFSAKVWQTFSFVRTVSRSLSSLCLETNTEIDVLDGSSCRVVRIYLLYLLF